jgi:putative restriction endonuclease
VAVSSYLLDDKIIRQAAFDRVRMLTQVYGDDIPWNAIAQPIDLHGQQIALASKALGIFKPKQMTFGALSIKTTMPRAGRSRLYEDSEDADGMFTYSLQGDDPNNSHNRKLDYCYENQTPLIYFYAVAESVYKAIFPCFIEGIDKQAMKCHVSVVSVFNADKEFPSIRDSEAWRIERRYALRETKVRLHQAEFRERVLEAYGTRCAMTQLPVAQLLDAAHIMPDSHKLGVAEITNGLCLSRIHHRAFDANLIGVSPDYKIVVSKLMAAKDGIILEGGLKALHGTDLVKPKSKRHWPDQDLLATRFVEFQNWN